LLLPNLLHPLEQTFLLGLQSLYSLTLGNPHSQVSLLLGPKLLQLNLQQFDPKV
jgi:hypothetical protein